MHSSDSQSHLYAVTCPACLKTYSNIHLAADFLERSVKESTRFHCSRCDALFDATTTSVLKSQTVNRPDATEPPSASPIHNHSPSLDTVQTDTPDIPTYWIRDYSEAKGEDTALETLPLIPLESFSSDDFRQSWSATSLLTTVLQGARNMSNTSAAKLLLAPLLVVGILTVGTLFGGTAWATMWNATSSMSALPPTEGVYVDATQVSRTQLPDGSVEVIISGSARNESLDPLKKVIIETAITDQNGRLISRELVPLGTNLGKKQMNYPQKTEANEEVIKDVGPDLGVGQSKPFVCRFRLSREDSLYVSLFYTSRIYKITLR